MVRLLLQLLDQLGAFEVHVVDYTLNSTTTTIML